MRVLFLFTSLALIVLCSLVVAMLVRGQGRPTVAPSASAQGYRQWLLQVTGGFAMSVLAGMVWMHLGFVGEDYWQQAMREGLIRTMTLSSLVICICTALCMTVSLLVRLWPYLALPGKAVAFCCGGCLVTGILLILGTAYPWRLYLQGLPLVPMFSTAGAAQVLGGIWCKIAQARHGSGTA